MEQMNHANHGEGKRDTQADFATNRLHGAKGWLRLFVVVNLYIAPVLFALGLIAEFVGYAMSADGVLRRTIVVALVNASVGVFLRIKWILIARRLRNVVPGVVREVKQWLWITLVWSLFRAALFFLSGMDTEEILPGVIAGGVSGILSFAIWNAYFSVSKRVRATYLQQTPTNQPAHGAWVRHVVLLAASVGILAGLLTFADQMAYYVDSMFKPKRTALAIAVHAPGSSPETVTRVLSERLRKAMVPHSISASNSTNIEIRIPEQTTEDLVRIRHLLTQPSVIEFRLVHVRNNELVTELFEQNEPPDGLRVVEANGVQYFRKTIGASDTICTPEWVRKQQCFQTADAEYEVLMQKAYVDNYALYRPFFVSRQSEITGDSVAEAHVGYTSFGEPVINIVFDSTGAEHLARVTADYALGGNNNPSGHAARQMAIVLNGIVRSAPQMREPITGGRAQISGGFTLEEAELISNLLEAGPLSEGQEVTEIRLFNQQGQSIVFDLED